MATRTLSPLQRAYNTLKKKKSAYCKNKVGKTVVKDAAKRYVNLAVKKGQTRKEAQKKANRILNGGCSMSSRIAGTKKRRTTTKRKTTRRR